MRLPEFRSKDIFRNYGIKTPEGVLVTKEQYQHGNIDYTALKVPGVVKAQNMIGGRGKAGGILPYGNVEELKRNVGSLFEAGFSGNVVDAVLVEEKISIEKEAYLSIAIDRRAGKFVLMSSGKGGIDIESSDPSKMRSVGISNLIGLQKYQMTYAAKPLIEAGAGAEGVKEVIASLYRLFKEEKTLLAEINPLVIQPDGSLCAADAKIIIDDNTVRISDKTVSTQHKTSLQSAAEALGVNMVELDGRIAVISNGAGEGMTTLDQIVQAGGSLSLWIDLGGGALSAKPEVLDNFIERVMDTKPKVLLFTAFFQIGKCDLFAESFRKIYLKRKETKDAYVPQIILRLDGRNAMEAKAFSKGTDMLILDSSQEACEMAARLSSGGA